MAGNAIFTELGEDVVKNKHQVIRS